MSLTLSRSFFTQKKGDLTRIDKGYTIVTDLSNEVPEDHHKRWRLLLFPGSVISFAFPKRGGGSMYITLAELIALASFIVLLIDLIYQNKKK